MSNDTVRTLFEKYANLVFRLAVQQLFCVAEAEDVVQEVFFSLIKSGVTFRDAAHEKAWMIRVTSNKCADILKSARVQRNVALTDQLANTLSVTLDDDEIFIARELEKLEPDERTVLQLYYTRQMNVREIAEALHANVNTVKSRLRRARERMRDNITL